jgi:hypothetical protein
MKTASHYSVDFFKDSATPTQPVKQNKLFKKNALSQVWHFLARTDSEPRIQQKFDRLGHVYWKAFDPLTRKTQFFETEDEVRRWLEQRYYQQA